MSLMQKLDEKIDWINDGYDKDLFMACKQEIKRLQGGYSRLQADNEQLIETIKILEDGLVCAECGAAPGDGDQPF